MVRRNGLSVPLPMAHQCLESLFAVIGNLVSHMTGPSKRTKRNSIPEQQTNFRFRHSEGTIRRLRCRFPMRK